MPFEVLEAEKVIKEKCDSDPEFAAAYKACSKSLNRKVFIMDAIAFVMTILHIICYLSAEIIAIILFSRFMIAALTDSQLDFTYVAITSIYGVFYASLKLYEKLPKSAK